MTENFGRVCLKKEIYMGEVTKLLQNILAIKNDYKTVTNKLQKHYKHEKIFKKIEFCT